MRAFHPKFINFGGVEIIDPSFNGVKSNTFGNHILAAFATNMERCFISNFATAHSLTFYNFKWLILSQLALFGWHLGRVVILRIVEVIRSCCSKGAHINTKNYNKNNNKTQPQSTHQHIPQPMQQVYKQPHPSTISIPFRQLTYLQYCMFPHLFEQYIGYLLNEENYQAMADIFVLYTQTLFQLVPFPQGEDRDKSDLGFFQGSAIGGELLKLLQFVMANFPVEYIQMIFNTNVPANLYNLMCSRILDLFSDSEQQIWKMNPEDSHNFKIFIGSIPSYFFMLRLHQDLKKSKKLLNLPSLQQQLHPVQTYQQQHLSKISQNFTIYHDFSQRYRKMLQKLKFVLKGSSTQKVEKQKDEDNFGMEVEEGDNGYRLADVHLNCFYYRCVSVKEKVLFIKTVYDDAIRNGVVPVTKLRQIQLMCLLTLQQLKNSKIGAKLQLYVLLMATKTQLKQSTQNLLQQLKLLFSFQTPPKISYIFPLISSIISLKNPQNLPQIIDFILKSYIKIHNNNDPHYIRLAIISSLYLHHKGNVVKSSSRKLQLEKLCQFREVIGYFNNLEILDYLVELVLAGKDGKDGKEGKDGRDRNGRDYEGLGQIFTFKDMQAQFKEYFNKITIVQDGDEQVIDPPMKKLLPLLSVLIQKRLKLTSLSNPNDYFHSHLLSLLPQTLTHPNPQKPPKTTQTSLKILHQYTIIAPYQQLNQTTIKLLFLLLTLSLSTGMNGDKYRKQALFCYLLGWEWEDVNWEKVENFVRNFGDDFGKICWELFWCIPGYQFVEILVENFRGYQSMMNQWIVQDQNFISCWPDSKKDRALIAKRSRFINYLTQKLSRQPK